MSDHETEILHARWRVMNYNLAPVGFYTRQPAIVTHGERAEQLAAEDMIEFGGEDPADV